MKKVFAYITIFILFYSVFVIALMPASWLMTQIKLPSNVSIAPVEGTIWRASVKQVMVDDVVINKLQSELSLISVFMLDPKLNVTFGDPLINGPEGKLTLSGLLADLTISDAKVSLAANTVASRLNLPIDIIAHELLTLDVSRFVMGAPICEELIGDLEWRAAAVSAFDEKVKLGKLSAALSCDKGELVAEVAPNNDLGLSYRAQLKQGGRFAGNGYLTPGEKFPQQLQEVLGFLGKPDSKGRYRLKI